MPPKAKKKNRRTVSQTRNMSDTGDLLTTDRGISVVIGDDDTVVINAPGFSSEIDMQHSIPATADALSVSQVRVRLRPAPYERPGAPIEPIAPKAEIHPDEVTPEA